MMKRRKNRKRKKRKRSDLGNYIQKLKFIYIFSDFFKRRNELFPTTTQSFTVG